MTEEKDGISRLVLVMTDEELKELDELALETGHVTGISKNVPNRSAFVREAIKKHIEITMKQFGDEDKKTPELKPCPFCGSDENKTFIICGKELPALQIQCSGDVDDDGEPKRQRVICCWCETGGPSRRTREDAIKAWNTRVCGCEKKEMGE